MNITKMKCKTIKEANIILFKRYLKVLIEYKKYNDDESIVLAKKMCKSAISVDMYEDKQSRWLGFVQGTLYRYDLIDIDEERDFSRPLFYSAYKEMGLDIPLSISV